MPGNSALTGDERAFVRRLVLVIAAGSLIAAIWVLAEILLLFFGGILLSLVLRAGSDRVAAAVGISHRWAIATVLIGLVLLLATLVVSFGPAFIVQLDTLADRLPLAFAALQRELGLSSLTEALKAGVNRSGVSDIATGLLSWSTALVGSLTAALLVLFGAVYLAAEPERYRQGFVTLIPQSVQPAIAAAMDDSAIALRNWLGAQAIAMTLVGSLTAIGLWLIGVPAALALGVISGLLDFVPFVGPLIAAIPVLAIALTQDWGTALSALVLIVVLQQAESVLIAPLLTGRMTMLPPAIGLFAVIAMGLAFGPLGLIFGYPLAITIDALLRRLYVRETLGERVPTASETNAGAGTETDAPA